MILPTEARRALGDDCNTFVFHGYFRDPRAECHHVFTIPNATSSQSPISDSKIPQVPCFMLYACSTPFLITVARTAPGAIVILLNHISTRLHRKLAPLQNPLEHRIPRIHQLDRLQLGLVPYPRVAASI